MIKVSLFSGESKAGPIAIPLFGPADSTFEKIAYPTLLPDVTRYIESLRPHNDAQYVLVNAMGASEWFGSNINSDAFPEASLIHCPDDWTGNPVLDKIKAKNWAYGFPTFYNAHAFCFPANTQIVMANRIRKNIDQIRIGETVATASGPRKVAKIFRRIYKGVGIKLRLRGEYKPLVGTGNHPVLVYRRKQINCKHKYNKLGFSGHENRCPEFRQPIGDPEWAPLSSILPGDYLVLPQVKHGEVKVRSEFAELIGWIASEGYISKKGIIQFSFSKKNKADIHKVTNCLKANGLHVCVTPRPQYGLVMLSACSVILSKELVSYIVGIKSTKRLTNKILTWDHESLLRMLGAYVDGDGHIPRSGNNRGQLRIRSSSPQMLRILSDVVRSLSIPATVQWDKAPGEMISPTNGKKYPANGSGVVVVTPLWAFKITKYSRKLNAYKPSRDCRQSLLNKTFLVQVTKRTDFELDEEVFNLEVPGPHHYIANEVLVHNCHHRNKNAAESFGDVELAVWNNRMKRVELVIRVDKERCQKFGATGVWDKLKIGEFPSVSMGTRVPWDRCSICTDLDKYYKALSTFDPAKHKHPGEAVLIFHKALKAKNGVGIRGISITRKDYCHDMKTMMNKILPDGRKVFVYNDFPRFFDISFVFIGADKTAYTMLKIAFEGKKIWSIGSAELAEKLGCISEVEEELPESQEKTASADVLKTAFLGKLAKNKEGEIVKDVIPSQFAGEAIPILTKNEPHLPDHLLDELGHFPTDQTLSTATGLGFVLRPREFQRLIMIRMGMRPHAEDLDRKSIVFPRVEDGEHMPLSSEAFNPEVAKLLLPLLMQRSLFGPAIERRILIAHGRSPKDSRRSSSLSSPLLHKIGSAYTGYRRTVMDLVANAQNLISSTDSNELLKIAAAPIEEVFTPLSVAYLNNAYWDEVGTVEVTELQKLALRSGVERGLPLRNTNPGKRILGGYPS